MSETVAGVVGQWVAGLTYAALPDRIRLEAKKALINSVGTAIGGFAPPDAQHAINVAKADNAGNSTLLVDGGRVRSLRFSDTIWRLRRLTLRSGSGASRRRRLGLSQKRLAELLGIDEATVRRW